MDNELGQLIKQYRTQKGMTQADLAQKVGTTMQNISQYERGIRNPKIQTLQKIADALGVDVFSLADFDTATKMIEDDWNREEERMKIKNVLPLPKTIKKVPLYDGIACGDPRYADPQEVDMMELPDGVRADFAVRCHGDSMIGAHIQDGDIVYIRQQEDVEDGEIAAVLIDDDATLKKVYHQKNGVLLVPANPNYKPLNYTAEDCVNIRIMGKAVACLSKVR